MGFLDHSTNNIIIDAVLTNLGREILASNAGAFRISSFSLADDEVDYSMIRKFGRTIGKEKIIKNTPIFEAQTAQDIALKYKLQTLSDPSVTHLPYLSATVSETVPETTSTSGGSVTAFTIKNGAAGGVVAALNIVQSTKGGNIIPAGLSDQSFDVFLNTRFLVLQSGGETVTFNSLDPLTMMARYQLTGAGSVKFTIAARSITNEDFAFYGDTNGLIKTMVSVVGRNSGARIDMICSIQQ